MNDEDVVFLAAFEDEFGGSNENGECCSQNCCLAFLFIIVALVVLGMVA